MAEERLKRRLAAILSADVVGYARLMGADEAGTLARLNTLRREILDPTISAHSGRVVKLMGDGVLAEFASVVEAVNCAIEIQQQVTTRDNRGSEAGPLRYRIGVHIGDVIIEGGDIFGDGINIAARLETIAEPGGISLSEDAWRQVRGKVQANFLDTGEQSLKNISRPIRVYRVTTEAGNTQQLTDAPSVVWLRDTLSIAVLPFRNLSGDPDQEYFCDGVTEEIITALSRWRSFLVISRNSSFTYRGKNTDVRQIGRELGARYVVEGSVRKAGDRVRITAQVSESTTGLQI